MKRIVLYTLSGAIFLYLIFGALVAIPSNMSHYSIADYIVLAAVYVALFLLALKLLKSAKSVSRQQVQPEQKNTQPLNAPLRPSNSFQPNTPPDSTKILKPENIKHTEKFKSGSDYEELVFQLKQWKGKYFVDNGSRTSERQKATLQILLQDPEQDLYKLSSHGSTCDFCAPREGRVYSRSGTDSVFPPLAVAFQKIDPTGPNVLWNTYLVTHPNTLHTLIPWTPAGRTDTEIEEVKRFSSLLTNPLSHDPRTDRQKEMYRKKQVGRKKWLRRYHLFQRCSQMGIEKFPKTYKTFEKHALSNSEKYQEWMRQYSILMQK